MVGSRVLPEHFPVLLAQGARAQAAQAFNLSQNGCIHHFSPVLLALTTAPSGLYVADESSRFSASEGRSRCGFQ